MTAKEKDHVYGIIAIAVSISLLVTSCYLTNRKRTVYIDKGIYAETGYRSPSDVIPPNTNNNSSSNNFMPLPPASDIDEIQHIAYECYIRINEERFKNGSYAVLWDNDLANTAMVRASEITVNFSHTRPDGSIWWTVNDDIMYGENIAKGYNTADDAMKAWMGSPPHRKTILRAEYKSVGIYVYKSGNTIYWAQEFGY
jgi:uncharacterized protein YkwD